MKSKDFILMWLLGEKRKGKCASLLIEGDVLYSYGYHHPLCIRKNGKYFVNAKKVSATTTKQYGIVVSSLTALELDDKTYLYDHPFMMALLGEMK